MSGNAKRRREIKAIEKLDKKLETNKCWDELVGIHQACAVALYQHTMISQLSQDKTLHGFLQNPRQVVDNIQLLGRDIQQMNDELSQIRALHADKVGGAKDEAEMMRSFEIFEMYHLFMERHNGVVMPTSLVLLEAFNKAEAARDAAARQLMAQDPNNTGAIDVEVKPIGSANPASTLVAGSTQVH